MSEHDQIIERERQHADQVRPDRSRTAGDGFPRTALVALDKVAVDVLRDGDARVTENLRDDLEPQALGEHEPGAGVPEVVRMPVTEPGVLTDPG